MLRPQWRRAATLQRRHVALLAHVREPKCGQESPRIDRIDKRAKEPEGTELALEKLQTRPRGCEDSESVRRIARDPLEQPQARPIRQFVADNSQIEFALQ
jgi:hypothetical protein